VGDPSLVSSSPVDRNRLLIRVQPRNCGGLTLSAGKLDFVTAVAFYQISTQSQGFYTSSGASHTQQQQATALGSSAAYTLAC